MPPVPNVILARPGRTQPWPTSDACWSPAMPAIGGAPASAVAVADDARSSRRSSGSTDGGMRSDVEHRARPSRCRRRACRPVTAALVQVGDVRRAPSDSVHAIHVSTVPKHRSRARSGSAVSSRHASFVADSFGATRMPSACEHEARADGAQVLPADARADRLAGGAVPHDRRRPLVGDADRVDRAAVGERRARATSSAASAIAAASNSTKPGRGRVGQHLAVVHVRRRWRRVARSRRARCSCRRRRRGCSRPPLLLGGRTPSAAGEPPMSAHDADSSRSSSDARRRHGPVARSRRDRGDDADRLRSTTNASDGGDDAVGRAARRGADAAGDERRRATSADEDRRRASTSASRAVARSSSTTSCATIAGGHGDDDAATAAPGDDRRRVERRRSTRSRPARPRRTGSAGRACRG